MSKSKFGVALMTAFAVMAVSASGAQAINWTAASYAALISGEQSSPSTFSFGFENSTTAKCTTVGFEGELTAASSSLTLKTGSSGCTAFGFADATVTPNGCTFTLKPTSGSSDSFSGSGEIKCPEGKKIVVIGGNCETTIGAQSIGTVTYKTATAPEPDEIEATISTSAITYEKTTDDVSCPLMGLGVKINGTLSGTVKLKASKKSDLTPINIGMS